MTWSRVMSVPSTWNTCTGCGARPGGLRIGWLPSSRIAIGPMQTDSPTVTTILITGDARRRNRNSTAHSSTPRTGPGPPRETRAAEARPGHRDRDARRGRQSPAVLDVEVVVEPGHEVGQGGVREVQDPGGNVGDHESRGGQRIDAAQRAPGEDSFDHGPAIPLRCQPAFELGTSPPQTG